jgi:hypothetical protein
MKKAGIIAFFATPESGIPPFVPGGRNRRILIKKKRLDMMAEGGKRRVAMKKQKIFFKTIICVNEECFEDSLSACRYCMELASHGEKVSVSRRVEVEGVGSQTEEVEADVVMMGG